MGTETLRKDSFKNLKWDQVVEIVDNKNRIELIDDIVWYESGDLYDYEDVRFGSLTLHELEEVLPHIVEWVNLELTDDPSGGYFDIVDYSILPNGHHSSDVCYSYGITIDFFEYGYRFSGFIGRCRQRDEDIPDFTMFVNYNRPLVMEEEFESFREICRRECVRRFKEYSDSINEKFDMILDSLDV